MQTHRQAQYEDRWNFHIYTEYLDSREKPSWQL